VVLRPYQCFAEDKLARRLQGMEVIAGKQFRRPAAELLLKSKIRVCAASEAVCSPYLPAHYVKCRGSLPCLHSGSLGIS
jgi:hypothetical protein